MTLSVPTIILYSIALLLLAGGVFAFVGMRERGTRLVWFGLPVFLGAVGAALFIDADAAPSSWTSLCGTFLILLAYGFGWQAIRAFYGRRLLPLAVILPAAAWLLVTILLLDETGRESLGPANGMVRVLLVGAFTGLAAWEFWRSKDEPLPSRRVLFWIAAVYTAFCLVRVPFVAILPAPLGAAPSEDWAVATFNLTAAALVVSVIIFMVAMARERSALAAHRLALTDDLAGIGNRRAYLRHLDAFGGGAVAPRFALITLDIDAFKSINDRFGHDMGDRVIVLAARAAEGIVGARGKVFRLGGDEFVAVLPGIDEEAAFSIADAIRSAFAAGAERIDGLAVNATVSVGIAVSAAAAEPAAAVYERADRALYEAKRDGRNRTTAPASARPRQA